MPVRGKQTKVKAAINMNTFRVKGNWYIVKGKLKQKFAQLTEDDLQYVKGKEEELVGRILKRTGKTREEVDAAIIDCCCRDD